MQQIQQPVYTFDAAFKRLMAKLIEKGFKVNHILPINNHRYIIVKGEQDGKEKNIMLMFKREVFFNFFKIAQSQGYHGVGESINCEDLKECLRRGVTEIYTTYPSGIAYQITLQKFLEKSIRWHNKENKDIRSISIHELKRYDTM